MEHQVLDTVHFHLLCTTHGTCTAWNIRSWIQSTSTFCVQHTEHDQHGTSGPGCSPLPPSVYNTRNMYSMEHQVLDTVHFHLQGTTHGTCTAWNMRSWIQSTSTFCVQHTEHVQHGTSGPGYSPLPPSVYNTRNMYSMEHQVLDTVHFHLLCTTHATCTAWNIRSWIQSTSTFCVQHTVDDMEHQALDSVHFY